MGLKARRDPGYFAVLRRLRARRRRVRARAADAAGLDRARRLELAWARADDPIFLRALYRAAARRDPELALALGRLESAEPTALEALAIEGIGPLVPLLVSMLETGERQVALAVLARAGEPLGSARVRGDRDRDRRLLARLPEADPAVVRAAGARRLIAAIEPLCELLWSPAVLEACEALAAIGEPAAAGPLLRFREALGGGPAAAPYALFADNALSALGHSRPVDPARAILDEPVPRRLGLAAETLARVASAAMAALVDRGDRADRERVAGFLDAPIARFRARAIAAYRVLGRRLPPLRVWDPARIERAPEAARLAALDDPGAIGKGAVIETLIAGGSSRARRRAVEAARRRLESRVNTWIEEPDDAPAEDRQILAALATLGPGDRALLAGSRSAWIRAFVLDAGPMPPPVETSAVAAAIAVEVERLDRVPFVLGAQINGLAISADGRYLAVVGDHLGKVLDAGTGDFVAPLDPGWSWGYDCAFTPGGALIAAFHGGHLETYDPASGARLRRLSGHAGAPFGVARVAVSPDGALAVSAGKEGQVIAWRLATGELAWRHDTGGRSCEAVAFSPAGDRVLAAHAGVVTACDPATGAAERIEVVSPVSAIAVSPDGRHAALGGADGVRLCRADDLSVKRALKLPLTTRLAFSADGRHLLGCSAAGAVRRWAIEDPAAGAEDLLETGAPLRALAVTAAGEIWTAGSSGAIHRIGESPTPGDAHRAAVTAIEPRGDRLLSADAGGRVLEWPREGGSGRERLALEGEGEVHQLVEAGDRVLAAAATGLYAIDARSVDRLGAGGLAIAVSADRLARGAGRDLEIARLPSLESLARVAIGAGEVTATCTHGDGFAAGTSAGEVGSIAGDWLRVDHGRDLIDGRSPAIRDLVDLGDGLASAGADDTVRIYRPVGGVPIRAGRLHLAIGPRTRLALSPDRAHLAIPSPRALFVLRLADGAMIARLMSHEHFENETLTAARYTGRREIAVGSDTGRLFRVAVSES